MVIVHEAGAKTKRRSRAARGRANAVFSREMRSEERDATKARNAVKTALIAPGIASRY